MKKILLACFIFCMSVLNSSAQTDTIFWFAAPAVSQKHGDGPVKLWMTNPSNKAITVTISMPAATVDPIAVAGLDVVTIPALQNVSVDLSPCLVAISANHNALELDSLGDIV